MERSVTLGRAARLAVLALAGVMLLSGKAFPELAAPLLRLASIETEGEAEWHSEELRSMLAPFLGAQWNAETEATMRTLLEGTGRYREIDFEATVRGDSVDLLVSFKPKFLLERIVFHGYQALSLRELERGARLPIATALDDKVLNGVEQRLVALYRKRGFPQAVVRAEVIPSGKDEAEVHVWIREGSPQVIDAIEWSGADVPDRAEFLRALRVRTGERWTAERGREVQKAAVRYFRSRGYWEARVTSEFVEMGEHGGHLHLHLRSGPLCEVVTEGNRKISRADIFEAARLWDRLLITDGTWRLLARTAERLYQEKGHYLVSVQLSIDRTDPEKKRIRLIIEEGPVLRIRRVEFEGRARVPAKKLLEVMLTGAPSWIPRRDGFLVPARFEEDLKRVWFRYRELGFVDAEITDYRIHADRTQKRIDITIVVDEGTPVVIAEVDFAGLPPSLQPPPLEKVRRDRPLDPFALEREAEQVAQYLREAGYGDAKAEAQWRVIGEDAGRRQAVVTFEVDPGPLQRVGRVWVSGNLQVESSLVRRESRLKPQGLLTAQELARAQNRLYQLGLFRSVLIDVVTESTQSLTANEVARDVWIRVQERAPLSLNFGGGYNTRDGFRAFGELAHMNLRHRGERLAIRGDIALDPAQATVPNEYILDLGLRDPQFLETSWSSRVNFVGQRATRSIDQFSIDRVAVVPAIERRWRPALLGGLELQFEQARIFDLRPDARAFNPGDEGKLRTGSIGPFLVYEGRDDPFMPHRGVFESLRFRVAPAFLGSDEPLAKLQWHHSHYIPLNDSVTWLYALRMGWARTFSGAIVPIRERFFLGGRSTVRGFSENSIGPLGAPIVDPLGRQVFPGGNPLGGDLSVNVNTELRFPLLWGAFGVAFADGGGVYLQNRSVSLGDFRRSAGLGLLYETPVGPLALHYGVKLDRRRGESFGAVHFTIGTLF